MARTVVGRTVEVHNPARRAMTWKDRQRMRVPLVDLDENPMCVERRTNDEWRTMQRNKNPTLHHLTSADVPRTASFLVDTEKTFREFSRKKRNLLAWSLRAATASGMEAHKSPNQKPSTSRCMIQTVPSDFESIDVDEFFNQELGSSDRVLCPTNHADADIDTLPNLEPYRREVVAQQPVTFGHRPVSASRMFNPCTMATSFGIPSGSTRGRKTDTEKYKERGEAEHAKRGRSNKRASQGTGLSAPMLKALLRGDTQTRRREAAVAVAVASKTTSYRQGQLEQCLTGSTGSRDSAPKAKSLKYLVLDRQEDFPDSSQTSQRLDESMRQPVAPGRGGVLGDLEAAQLTNSSLEGLEQGRLGLGNSVEGRELQRIFSTERPPWDGTPAPLPAPQNVRRAISSLLMPDPDERLRDKLNKSRKAAAGVPVTASSAKDEREKSICPYNPTPTGRWEVCPATPRAVIAHQEIRRLTESRMERDNIMAKRVRQAELSVFFNKIAPTEKLYRNTLRMAQDRFQSLGATA